MSADIVFSSTKFPAAVIGVAYEAAIGIKSFATAVTAMSVTSGALPDGLVVNADKSRITGTPTKLGTFTFALSATDTAGTTASGNFTISVVAQPNVANLDESADPVATQLAREWPLNYS